YKKGVEIGGPPVGAAFAAMSIARTGMMISQIRSTQIGGGGSMGGVGGASGGVAAAPPPPIQRIDVAWNGPSEARPGMQSILDVLNDAAARGLRVDARLVSE